MQEKHIINTSSFIKYSLFLLMTVALDPGITTGASSATQQDATTNKQSSQSALYTKRPSSAARQSVTNTAIDLRRAYHTAPMANQATLRQQKWWVEEYSRRQQFQRLVNWKNQKEAVAYARNIADPKSPESIKYRNAALHMQALQSKLPAEQRTQIPLRPIMRSARSAPS